MRRTVIISFIMFAFSLAGQGKEKRPKALKPIVVEIVSGNGHETRRAEVAYSKTITALEALLRVAEVKTHPLGSYVFVTEIDNIKAERGKMAWYYKINGKSPKRLAISQTVNSGDTISWRFVKDVCSEKADEFKKPQNCN